MDEKKRLIRNTGIIAIGNVSIKLVSFLLLPLYTSLLSTNEYGIIDYICSIAAFAIPFITLLMDESIFRFLIDCKTEKEKTKVISTSFFTVLIGVIVFYIAFFIFVYMTSYQYAIYFGGYIFSSVISMMISALLRGIGRIEKYVAFNFFCATLQIILNIIFIAILKLGVAGMLSATIISQLLVSAIYIYKLKLWNYISFRGLNISFAKEMITYSIPLIPNKLSWSIINLSDRIIIMNAIGSSQSGLYAVAYKFPNLMDTIYGFFYQSWKESSARVMGNADQNTFYNLVYSYLKDFMYAIVIGMTAFMPVVFSFFIDSSYQQASKYVPILLIATYFANISGFYGGIFTAYKNTKIMGMTTILAAVINLVINLATIYFWGLYAAAISTLVANVVVYYYRKNKVKEYIELKENNKKKFLSILITSIILGFYYSNQSHLMILGMIISVVYAVIINKNMLVIIRNQMMRRVKKS